MKKEQKQKEILNLDQFDQTVSFWQLIRSGAGRGQKRLEFIIDSILNGQMERSNRPLSLLISGNQGCRTHARSFLRGIGLEHPNEMPANVLQLSPYEMYSFFGSSQCDSYIISSISLLYPGALKFPYEVITKGYYSTYYTNTKATEIVPVIMPLIMTTHNLANVPKYFLEKIDHVIEIEDYSDTQLELIILQRLKYCNLDYKEEKVLTLIRDYGAGNLIKMIRVLKSAITVMLADGRTTLTFDDIQKVMSYL